MRRSETRGQSNGGTDTNRGDGRFSSNRRRFLQLTGASAVAFGGLGAGSAAAGATSVQDDEGGPPDQDDWELTFEDEFDGDSLDSNWGVGWGWGTTSEASDAEIDEENVTIDDDVLQLSGTNDGGEVLAGGINTKGNVEFGPGSYVEARLQFPERVGFNPAFWAKPASEEWPPELDIVECIQDGSGEDDVTTSRHFIHFSVSTEPGDDSTQDRVEAFYEPGDNITENFHVYAAEWQEDRVTYYVDGEEVQTWTNSTILESLRQGAPFYINLIMNVNVDSELNDVLGQADPSESWGESLDADWVRVWEQ